MRAIVKAGGHQYHVRSGQFLRLEVRPAKPGDKWSCTEIVALQNGQGKWEFGEPYVKGAEVLGKVMRLGKKRKVLVFKKKRRKGYTRTQGHRQKFTEIYIENLVAPSGEEDKKPLKSKPPSEKKPHVTLKGREEQKKTAEGKK